MDIWIVAVCIVVLVGIVGVVVHKVGGSETSGGVETSSDVRRVVEEIEIIEDE
ncbi:hypothetical protein L0Y40_01050 [Candidatus Wolfebacteria bacterium]|nr:hypothetical protein [Candidatus Wolfebacteria bacterium]